MRCALQLAVVLYCTLEDKGREDDEEDAGNGDDNRDDHRRRRHGDGDAITSYAAWRQGGEPHRAEDAVRVGGAIVDGALRTKDARAKAGLAVRAGHTLLAHTRVRPHPLLSCIALAGAVLVDREEHLADRLVRVRESEAGEVADDCLGRLGVEQQKWHRNDLLYFAWNVGQTCERPLWIQFSGEVLRESQRLTLVANHKDGTRIKLTIGDHALDSLSASDTKVARPIDDGRTDGLLVRSHEILDVLTDHNPVLDHLVPLDLPAAKRARVDSTHADTLVSEEVSELDDIGEMIGGAHDDAPEPIQLLVLPKVALDREELDDAVLCLHLLERGRVGEDEVNLLGGGHRLVGVEFEWDERRVATVRNREVAEVVLEGRPPSLERELSVSFGDHPDDEGLVGEGGAVGADLGGGER
mmetsp:Transcript_15099/g.49207  ORF Transcript_15099/g.49207 Transcript_15099/m.49207 type:complete len:412 (-) Transcript_15099:87-1322(-)